VISADAKNPGATEMANRKSELTIPKNREEQWKKSCVYV